MLLIIQLHRSPHGFSDLFGLRMAPPGGSLLLPAPPGDGGQSLSLDLWTRTAVAAR